MKVNASRKCLQAKKKTCATPSPIGGKRHHTNQSQEYMANHVIWLLRNRGKLWEGRRRKIDSDGDGVNDSDSKFLRVERFVTLSVFGVYS